MRPLSTIVELTRLVLLLVAIQTTSTSAQDARPTAITTSTTAISSLPTMASVQSDSSTSSSVPQTYTIQVGLLDHKIRPEVTEAAVGDWIEFDFYPLNHSIVRAEYGFPCIPYEMTGSGKKGFFSGFNPVDKVLDNPPKYRVRVNDTEPIFFYCSAPGSCITYGMVGGINLNSSMSIDKQRTLAMDSAYMLQPGQSLFHYPEYRTNVYLGEPFPPESPLPSGNPATSVLPSSISQPSSSSTSVPAHTSSGALSTDAIVGIVIAAIGALLFAALLFFCWGRTKSLREAIERKDGTVRRVSASPNQMVQHAHTHHTYTPSQTGFHFPSHPLAHPGNHPGSPESGTYCHHQNGSLGSAGYFPHPTTYTAKYTAPTATYHAISPESLQNGTSGLDNHTFM